MKKVYCMFDTQVGHWHNPIFVEHKAFAIRAFENVANDPTTDVGRYPDQFCLFDMGEFNEETGEFQLNPTPISQGLGSQYVKPLEVKNAS